MGRTLTLPGKREMALEGIPARGLWDVAASEEEPGEKAGEVLYGAVELCVCGGDLS